MAKVTKNVLKGIVKECLVEILSEGLNVDTPLARSSSKLSGVTRRKSAPPKRRPSLDNVTFGKKVDEATSTMTDDPLMSAIFADTARTTLQEQMQHDSRPGQPATSSPGINLDSIFSESADNWSHLAFSDKKIT